jgi:NAD(P)-dependent dehydrogenase (short-subunit alcohol dehydrogenase family)
MLKHGLTLGDGVDVSVGGQRVFVAGGTGEVGEGIVRQFLQAEATVMVPSRSEEWLENLREQLAAEATERLITRQANLGDMASAQDFAASFEQELGAVQHVVASLGGWWRGQPFVELDLATWQQLIDNSLTAHFVCARAFLPQMLAASGSCTLINGGGALHPVPGSGSISVSAAAQIMLQRVLAAELADSSVCINSLLLAIPIKTRSRPTGSENWLSAAEAGQFCLALAQGSRRNRHL